MLRQALDLGVTTPGLPAATFESEDTSDIIKVDLGQVLLPIQRFLLSPTRPFWQPSQPYDKRYPVTGADFWLLVSFGGTLDLLKSHSTDKVLGDRGEENTPRGLLARWLHKPNAHYNLFVENSLRERRLSQEPWIMLISDIGTPMLIFRIQSVSDVA